MDAEQPKVFISYSWSSQDHIQWVVDLAHELGDSGVHVILDKFDLREGDDSIKFMERIVNDLEVKKVLMICDKVYAEKTDARSGGAGVEAQIISPRIYSETDKGKFVAVLSERSPEGKPYLPTYYASRIYIDLSDKETYTEQFEQLIRWINDKPLYQRRAMGQRPAYLDEQPEVSLGTAPSFGRAVVAIKGGRPVAGGALSEYFATLSANLERLRMDKSASRDSAWDEQFMENLRPTLTVRNELNQIFESIAVYDATGELGSKVHRFFESLIPYFDRPEGVNSWSDTDFDNFRFLGYEFFLHALTIFIAHERFDLCGRLLNTHYYYERNREFGKGTMVNFTVFNEDIKTLAIRNDRLKTRYISPVAMLIQERLAGTTTNISKIVQADLVAYIRSDLDSLKDDQLQHWWPNMGVFARRLHGPLEIFARAQSKAYFDRIKAMFAVSKAEDLQPLFKAHASSQRAPRFDWDTINVASLMGADKLSSKL